MRNATIKLWHSMPRADKAFTIFCLTVIFGLTLTLAIQHKGELLEPPIEKINESISIQRFPDKTVYRYDQWPWICVLHTESQQLQCGKDIRP